MRTSLWLILVFASVIAVSAYLSAPFFLNKKQSTDILPSHGRVMEFSMTDTEGKPFGSNDLKGKVWVANFIFTSCPGQCPRMTAELAKIYRSYQLESQVSFVSFTVDPDRDNPTVLKKYAEERKINTSIWHFLTAPIEMIHRLSVEGFKIGTIDNPLFHSERFVLIDHHMNVRGYYDAESADELKKLFGDVANILQEAKNEQGK